MVGEERRKAILDRQRDIQSRVHSGQPTSQIAKEMRLSHSTVRRDAKAALPPSTPQTEIVVSELIGRSIAPLTQRQSMRSVYTVDAYRPDYMFWDKLRSCKAAGYELSGLFCKPITEILASYVLGQIPTYSLDIEGAEGEELTEDEEKKKYYTEQKLVRWLSNNHACLMDTTVDCYGLGDTFVIVNPDASITVPSPDTVDVEWDVREPSRMVAVTITSRFKGVIITDIYTDFYRQRTIKYGSEETIEYFSNLLGILPIIHFPNDRRANELFGRPVYEATLPNLAGYNDLIMKALEGVKVMGNPIPVFEGLENIAETLAANAVPTEETYLDQTGTEVTRPTIAFDTAAAIFVGKGGAFNFKAPQVGFTEDMRRVLKSLFLLICDHTRIPEYMWGGAVEASKASTETQQPPFIAYVDYKRTQLDGNPHVYSQQGLKALIGLVLKTWRLTDPKIVVADVSSQWQNIALQDEQIKFQKTIYADGKGYLTKSKALDLLSIVHDPKREVELAEEEAPEMEADYETMLNQASYRNAQPGVNGGKPGTVTPPPDPDGGRNVNTGDGVKN